MSQEIPPPAPSKTELHAYLHAIAELLREPHRLDAAARAALADLVDELDKAVTRGDLPGDEAARLAETAAQFAEAVHRGEQPNVLQAARERMEEAAVAAESYAPVSVGLARRVINALSNIGI